MTLGLIGLFLIALAAEPDGWGALGPEHLVVALHWVGVAVLWWLGVGSSPLGRVVAASDLLSAGHRGGRAGHGPNCHPPYPPGELARAGVAGRPPVRVDGAPAVDPGLRADAPGRAIHQGSIAPATAMTLILASLTLGLVATATGWLPTLFGGGIAWSAGLGVTGLIVAQRVAWAASGQPSDLCLGRCATAAFGLLALAGWLRRDPSL